MSEERRKRQEEREQESLPSQWPRRIAIAAVIVVVVASLVLFLRRKHNKGLDAFAQCLTARGAKMYGAYWCPHCDLQKEKFGSSFQYAPYVECGIKGSRAAAQVCIDAKVNHYPTWVFADGARVEGEHELEFLGQATGCALP